MTEQIRPPPDDELGDVTWPELLRLANQIAMDYRRALFKERHQHAAIVADKDRQIEIYKKLIRTFEIHNNMQGPR